MDSFESWRRVFIKNVLSDGAAHNAASPTSSWRRKGEKRVQREKTKHLLAWLHCSSAKAGRTANLENTRSVATERAGADTNPLGELTY